MNEPAIHTGTAVHPLSILRRVAPFISGDIWVHQGVTEVDLRLHFLLLLPPVSLYCGGGKTVRFSQLPWPSAFLGLGTMSVAAVGEEDTVSRVLVCQGHWTMIHRSAWRSPLATVWRPGFGDHKFKTYLSYTDPLSK